ncbi:MAG: CarD family transcriptional regulator [Candidatus Saccharibacteria bacterium]|nr:CarD family transcriptional regulator [Candidatus Saccharibacteria bacterium]
MADPTQRIFEDFLGHYTLRTFKKGEIIIFQGEAPRAAFVVKSGVVKAYNLSVNGDEKPVGFYTPFDTFPGAWTYGKTPSAIYYYEAFTDEVQLYTVPRDDYVTFIRSSPEIMYAELQRYVVDHLAKSMRLNALQHSRAGDKLIYTLHYLSLSHGIRKSPQLVEITLNLTHQDFANLTGLTRETAATELNKLKHLGIISYGKNTPYQIRLDKLANLLNDQYIAELELKL